MLLEPTLDKLRELKFYGMMKALQEQLKSSSTNSMSFEERLGLLVDEEVLSRENKRLATRLRQAKLKQRASFEDIDFRQSRNMNKAHMMSLASCKRKFTCTFSQSKS